jgi:hypothetical protein
MSSTIEWQGSHPLFHHLHASLTTSHGVLCNEFNIIIFFKLDIGSFSVCSSHLTPITVASVSALRLIFKREICGLAFTFRLRLGDEGIILMSFLKQDLVLVETPLCQDCLLYLFFYYFVHIILHFFESVTHILHNAFCVAKYGIYGFHSNAHDFNLMIEVSF